jgi:hypothetical protein
VTAHVGGEEPDFPKRGKANQGPPQPMLRPHGHLKCHWLPKFFPLSSLIQPLSPPNPCSFYSTYPVINPEAGVSPAATTNY